MTAGAGAATTDEGPLEVSLTLTTASFAALAALLDEVLTPAEPTVSVSAVAGSSGSISQQPAVLMAESAAAAKASYRSVVDAVQGLMARVLPVDAVAAVISRGDPALLPLDRGGRHFPCDEGGTWIGYHPEAAAAVVHLDDARRSGATHLVVPEPSRWWLDHYTAMSERLAGASLVADEPGVAVVYELGGLALGAANQAASPAGAVGPAASAPAAAGGGRGSGHDGSQLAALVGAVLPEGAVVLVVSGGDPALLDLGGRVATHFPSGPDGTWWGDGVDERATARSLRDWAARGARFLVVPESAGWAERVPTLWDRIVRHRTVLDRPGLGRVFDLGRTAATGGQPTGASHPATDHPGPVLSGTDLPGSVLPGTDLPGTDLSDTDLSDIDEVDDDTGPDAPGHNPSTGAGGPGPTRSTENR